MCIAIIKPAAVMAPDLPTLQRCFRNNPDGAGFVVMRGNALRIHKGFMHWADFERAWLDHGPLEHEMAGIHFRITTAGGTRPQNCHPFPLSQNEKDLQAVTGKADEAMIHNGIFGSGSGNLSDTMLFIRDHLADPFIRRGLWNSERCRDYIDRLVRGSRVAVFRKDGTFYKWGEWTDVGGVLYSNSSYQADYSRWGGWYGSGYGREYWPDDDIDDSGRITKPTGCKIIGKLSKTEKRLLREKRREFMRGGTAPTTILNPPAVVYNNWGKPITAPSLITTTGEPIQRTTTTVSFPKCPSCGAIDCRYDGPATRREGAHWECACGHWFKWAYPDGGESFYQGHPQICGTCGEEGSKFISWDNVSRQWECENCGQVWEHE